MTNDLPHACYVAAPLASAERANEVARKLRARRVRVCSRWHASVPTGASDPKSETERRGILDANIADLEMAGVVLALTDQGSPGATYAEIGWAIAQRANIVWLQGQDGTGRNIFDAGRGVTRAYDLDEAIEATVSIAAWRGFA